MKTFGLVAACLVLVTTTVLAHVAPAVRENNRYLKIIPLGDQIRVAYTLYYGEVPGQVIRKTMDKDGDGTLSEDEAKRYGDELGENIAEGLEISVDGVRRKLRWEQVYVALDDRKTQAGAFPVDFVAWLCLDEPKTKLTHTVRIHDNSAVAMPGEVGIRVDASPGVDVTLSRAKGDATDQEDLLWQVKDGDKWPYELSFTVAPDEAIFAPKKDCSSAPYFAQSDNTKPDESGGSLTTILAGSGAVVLALVVLMLAALLASRRRQRMKG